MADKHPRIVVTGMGAITAIGNSVAEYYRGLVSGKIGFGTITAFDITNYPVKVAAQVKNFQPTDYMDIKRVDRTVLATQYAIATARMALASAGLDMTREQAHRVGVTVGTNGGVMLLGEQHELMQTRGPNRVDVLAVSRVAPCMVAAIVGLEFGLRGPNNIVNSACASGSDAIAQAANQIRLGVADVMVAGGAEMQILPLPIAITNRVGALSRETDPKKACRPFDLNRSGMVYGDGGAMLVLESLEHAVNRGAPIMVELAGTGWSFDAFNETAPDYRIQLIAMRNAISNAGLVPDEIEYVNAHGTSTKLNDTAETLALKEIFGPRAHNVPISSNKSMIGHAASAAGAIEAVAAVMTIKEGIIPPTMGYETPDPECDLDYVPNVARPQPVRTCLSNSFGMGGQNCCLVFKEFIN